MSTPTDDAMTEKHEAVIHMRDMGLLHIQCEFQLSSSGMLYRFAAHLGVLFEFL